MACVAKEVRRAMKTAINVREYMETWARWRHRGFRFQLAPTTSITGRLLDGMQSTTCPTCLGRKRVEGWKVGSFAAWVDPCPTCIGSGRVSGSLKVERTRTTVACDQCEKKKDASGKMFATGEFGGRTCFKCGGRGRRVFLTEKVNPASIRSTRFSGANEDSDPLSEMIDRIVAQWSQSEATYWMHAIVILEYSCSGTQQSKMNELRYRNSFCRSISQSWYSKTLAKAHAKIEPMIEAATGRATQNKSLSSEITLEVLE